jgi:lipopolysaccharide export system protein LptA
MSAQRATAPARLAAAAAAIVLVALAAAVALRLAGRREVPSPKTAIEEPPPQDRVVDRKERVRHEEYEAGRLVAEIRGDAFSRGPDDRNRLAGSVEVTYFDGEGRTVSRLTAGEIAYAPGSLRFSVRSGVRVEAGDVVLEGDSFEYDKPAGLFETSTGGRFASRTLSGSAPEICYAEAADEVRLGGGFRAELRAAGGGTLALSGDSLRYARRERKGRMEGWASIAAEDFRTAAETVSFVVSGDEAGLDSAVLEGGAGVGLGGRAPSYGSGEIRADRIEVTFSRERDGLSVAASGRGRLEFRSDADGALSVAAPSALLNFSRKDGHWTWTANGGIRAELTGTGGAGRTIEGGEAALDGARTLIAYGAAGRKAVADSAAARIEAGQIMVGSASGSLSASGGVTGVLKPGDGSRRTGFFARGEDVAVSCQRLEAEPDAEALFLTGYVLVSQGSASVRGGEIELAGAAGRMSGGGGVAVTLTEAGPEGRPDRTVEIGGQEMAFRPDTWTLTLSSKAFVRLAEASLEAGSVSAVLGREDGGVISLAAAGGVTVSRGGYTGRAETACYDPGHGLLVLTGSPVLTDGKGGSARGAKLTFDLADDKILVENEGAGRSTTVIKS